MKLLRTALAVSALACAASLSGCISDLLAPSADPTVFHLISPVSMQKASAGKFDANLLPIQLPQYMVARPDRIRRFRRRPRHIRIRQVGGAPVQRNRARGGGQHRIFRSRVGVRVSGGFPQPRKSLFAQNIRLRCLGEVGGKVRLQGKWQIDLPGEAKSVVKNFNFEVSSKDGYAGYSAAVSELVGRLSAQISAELSKL